MHPRQASVLAEAQAVLAQISSKTAAAPSSTPSATPSGPILLWEYEDPDGNKFYLKKRKTTIRSPFSGKSFPAHPERFTPAQVGKELKDERKQSKTAGGDDDLVEYVNRLAAAAQAVLWQYSDPEGNLFWLNRRVTTTVRSPYGGPGFVTKPRKVLPSEIGKILRGEVADGGDSKTEDADEPTDLKAFAVKVLKVAKSPESKKFHGDRVFIASVKDLGFPRMAKPKFDSMLIEAHRSGLLRLTRADLVGAMDPDLVQRSEVRYQNATFNFVALDGVPWD